MGAGWSRRTNVCGWGFVQDQQFFLSRKSIFQGLKKRRSEKASKKDCQRFGRLGCSEVVATRVFLTIVSKLNVLRKGTISVHCTTINVGRSFVKGMEGLPRCCHSSHLHQSLHG